MKIFTLLVVGLFSLSVAKAQSGYYGSYYLSEATKADTDLNLQFFNNTATNNAPAVQIQTTPNFSVAGVLDNYPFGVYYYMNEWTVYNESHNGYDSIRLGSGWNVLVPSANGTSFVWRANNSNTTDDGDVMDTSIINGNRNAYIFVTHNYNPDTSTLYGNYVTAPLGVYYSGNEWQIVDEDYSSFVVNTAYNVFVADSSSNVFVQTANSDNLGAGGYSTYINNPVINGDSNAVLIVTQNLNPGDGDYIYNPHFVGVFYDADSAKWAIFNEDKVAFPGEVSFNVLFAGDKKATGIAQVSGNNNQLSVYPNPSSDYIHTSIQLNQPANLQLRLVNMLGQTVSVTNAGTVSSYQNNISVAGLTDGVYLLEAITDNGIETREVVVAR